MWQFAASLAKCFLRKIIGSIPYHGNKQLFFAEENCLYASYSPSFTID